MIVLGRVVAPFGVQGWVKIHPFGDDPLAWRRMGQWWLSDRDDADQGEWQAYRLKGCRVHGKGLVAAFEGVADRTAAEQLGGKYIGAPREALPETGEDEYYWIDLVGLTVANRAGERLGTVESLLETGAHDVLRVTDGDNERLIPFVAAYVLAVDVAGGTITVDWEADW